MNNQLVSSLQDLKFEYFVGNIVQFVNNLSTLLSFLTSTSGPGFLDYVYYLAFVEERSSRSPIIHLKFYLTDKVLK